jgi:hypothetical protein
MSIYTMNMYFRVARGLYFASSFRPELVEHLPEIRIKIAKSIKAAFSSQKESFWVSHRMYRKDIGMSFRILIKK